MAWDGRGSNPGLSPFSFGAFLSFAGESSEVDTPSLLPPFTLSSPARSAAPGGRKDIALGHLVPPLLLRCGPDLRRSAIHAVEWLVHVEPTRDELRLTVATMRCQQLRVHRHAPIRVARCLRRRTVFGRRLGRAGFPPGIQFHPALLTAFHISSPASDGKTATLGDGRTLRRLSDLHHRPYQSPFGEFDLQRFVYGTREGQAIELVPLDERLALPAGKFSYLLQEWDQSEVMEASFGQTSQIVKRILGLKQPVDSLEQMNRQVRPGPPLGSALGAAVVLPRTVGPKRTSTTRPQTPANPRPAGRILKSPGG